MKTDSQLQQDIRAELLWEPSIHAARIGVEVKDGVVTLSGQVDSYLEKWNAEQAAQRVSGANAMTTDLEVQLTSLSRRSDADIAASIENMLEWTATLPAGSVQVMVEAGWVTLSGLVDRQHQRRAVTDSVRSMMGVTGVSDQIGLRPAVSASAVKSDIEAALLRTARADAKEIRVDVHGGDITLSGAVVTWAEREAAMHAAWGSPGVRHVVDRMSVAS